MRTSRIIAGTALAVVLAVPVLAIAGAPMGMGPLAVTKRTDVETMVKDHFARADTDKDGAITRAEIDARHAAMRAEKLNAHFTGMDTDKNGSISRAEFDAAHAERMAERDDDDIDEKGDGAMHGHRRPHHHMEHHGGHHGDGMKGRMFEHADANKDGKVTFAEANTAALSHFDAMDSDKNGEVTATERMHFHKKLMEKWMSSKG